MTNYLSLPSEIVSTARLSLEVKSTGQDQQLGDGYVYRVQFGLHPVEKTWRVSFFLKVQQTDAFLAFLQARAMDGIPFLWVPPGETWDEQPGLADNLQRLGGVDGYPTLWTVDEWPVQTNVRGREAIDVVLRSRFDRIISQ